MGYPLGRWILRDRDMNGLTALMRQNHKDEQHPEKNSRDHEEVGRNHFLHVVREECAPRLRGSPRADHVFRNRRFGQLES